MIAVIYNPSNGQITQVMQSSEENIAATGPYVEVPVYRIDYDVTHVVTDGELVEKA